MRKPVWIDITNPSKEDIGIIASLFNIHKVVCEDCLTNNTPSKFESYGHYLQLVAYTVDPNEIKVRPFEVDFLMGENFLITVHIFRVKEIDDIKKNQGHLESEMRKGADHIFHTVLDVVIDNYFPLIEKIEEEVDFLEQEIIKKGAPRSVISRILQIKRRLLEVRKVVMPQVGVLHQLTRDSSPFISKEIAIYMKDVNDSIVKISSNIEHSRELASVILDVDFSFSTNRLNEVMKFLTIFSSIMMAVTFIASVYGMNFRFMPELDYRYGYFIILGFMALTSLGMIYMFRRKKWL